MVTSASVTVWCDSVKLVLLLEDDEEFAVVDETVLASAFKLEEGKGSLFIAIEDNDDHLFGVEDSLEDLESPRMEASVIRDWDLRFRFGREVE
ncbi:hypothetical protein R1sor_015988 [Riccia sorocarpa]|uniref:Uncharacterized protein n=1 Tax=Riccia sorocarpa TaxID=122646 RepID=A0ABD3HHR0_9MARC